MTGQYVPPRLGMITVGELAPSWLDRKETDQKPSTYRSTETAWRVHVAPRWHATRLADIDKDAVERWISAMSRAGSGATVVNRAHGVLSGILATAVKSKRLAHNPAQGVENLPKKQGKPHVYLNHAEVIRLAEAAGKHRVLVLVLAYCGIRWGEAVGLRVGHLNLLRKRMNIRENAVQVDNKVHVGSPKSGTGRAVPLPSFLIDELSLACKGKSADDLVFPGPDGNHLRRSVSSTGWFTRAVQKSGVPRVTPHDLRHTAASLAVSVGANVKVLQRMLGHASAAMTLDVYADLFDDDLEAIGAALDRAYSTEVVGKMWASKASNILKL